ncbi:hypothetical protein BC827DRAFT_326524 [Russula dissimulans]|nr:hypothetical protein BC827DRAFT_326524 [Russula dissimulans]
MRSSRASTDEAVDAIRLDFLRLIVLAGLCLKPLDSIAGSKPPQLKEKPILFPFPRDCARHRRSRIKRLNLSPPCIKCPILRLRQDRDRHIRAYLPHSIYCPFPLCGWRSDRPENLVRHWNTAHHGPLPAREQCQIYDPNWLVELILDGTSTVEWAAWVAQLIVANRAGELGKGDLWDNPWGRRMRSGQ